MDYGDSVQKVLLRKIQKAEHDLVQLKLDYCRFVYGLTHRSRLQFDGEVFLVRSVDVDSMERFDDGSFGKPSVTGQREEGDTQLVELGKDWSLVPEQKKVSEES